MTTPQSQIKHHQVAIIGAGPIGIELAIGLKQAGIKSLIHFEAGQIGSTINWWAPGTHFFSSSERIEIAGVKIPNINQEKATREQYLAYLRAVVQQFKIPIQTFTQVSQITRHQENSPFQIQSQPSLQGVGTPPKNSIPSPSKGSPETTNVTADNLILAIGNMHHPRLLNIPGESLPHVSHYLGEIHQYFNRNVAIIGGKNSAVEAAIRLYRAGAKVALIYRGTKFDSKRVKYWLKPELEWLIHKKRITFVPETQIKQIKSNSILIQSLNSSQTPPTTEINADNVLLLTGYLQDNTLFKQLNLELRGTDQAPKFDRTTMQSSIPSVYLAGTAAGGSQTRARFYIENTHIHVKRIVKAITGQDLSWPIDPDFTALEES